MEESSTSEVFVSIAPTIPANMTEFTIVNGSNGTLPRPVSQWWIQHLLTVIISLVGLAGNSIVLWLLGFHMHRNAFSVYILNLAAADFLFLCCHIIRTITFYSVSSSIYIHRFFFFLWIFAYIAGLSMLSAISIERCLSVLWPIWYRCHRPRHTSAVMCALLWVLSLMLTIMNAYCFSPFIKVDIYWCRIFNFIPAAWLIILFMVLSGSGLILLIGILYGSWRVPPTRLYVTIGLTVLVFLICGLPLGIVDFLLFWIHGNNMILKFSHRIALFLSSINSSANPIIYFLVGSCRRGKQHQRQRQTLKLVLEKALQDIPEVEKSGENLPQETMENSASP